MKKLIALFITSVLLAMNSTASAFEVKDADGRTIYFNVTSDSTVELAQGMYKYTGEFIIPDTITYNNVKYTVTSIRSSAMYQCTELLSVTIPSTVTAIGDYAFNDCI